MYNDFRPEVHDSDGLAILRGNGERIWRPLVNPPEVRVNAYADENPRGFGALQRDRDFANYQDDGIYYNRRPNLWVEPQGQWGPGAIYLIEIPANEESFDNIVAFWTPRETPQPGREIRLAYNLSWGRGVPDLYSPVGRVIATRSGIGGIPGQDKGRDTQKFVIDFKGGPLELLGKDAPVEAVISTSRGIIVKPATRPIRELDAWRTNFDLRWEGRKPVDLRCYLRLGTSALTETWSYQWTPPR
jgi:glucans biosynthesis protein